MIITTSVTGMVDPVELRWPDGWPLPSIGDPIYVPTEDGEDVTMYVRSIAWYPHGGVWGYLTDVPYVYLVVGPRRRT